RGKQAAARAVPQPLSEHQSGVWSRRHIEQDARGDEDRQIMDSKHQAPPAWTCRAYQLRRSAPSVTRQPAANVIVAPSPAARRMRTPRSIISVSVTYISAAIN